jgi:hypothetical protein
MPTPRVLIIRHKWHVSVFSDIALEVAVLSYPEDGEKTDLVKLGGMTYSGSHMLVGAQPDSPNIAEAFRQVEANTDRAVDAIIEELSDTEVS